MHSIEVTGENSLTRESFPCKNESKKSFILFYFLKLKTWFIRERSIDLFTRDLKNQGITWAVSCTWTLLFCYCHLLFSSHPMSFH